MTQTFIAEYAAANAALATARKDLATAIQHSTPLDADLMATLREHNPAGMIQCERQMAEIEATIPALTVTADLLEAAVEVLAKRACWHCHGTGRYQCPTSHLTRGVPVCWKCGGNGQRKVR